MTDARVLISDERGLSWRDSLEIIRHQWATLVVAVLLFGGGALLWTDANRPAPLYRSSAQVLLELRATSSPFKSSGGVEDPRRAMPTEIAQLSSDAVRSAVVRRLGTAPPVSGDAVGDTDMFAVIAVSSDPAGAADAANAYAEAYVDHRRQRALDAYETASGALEARIAGFDEEIAGLVAQISRGSLSEGALAQATRQRAAAEDERSTLVQRLVQYQVDSLVETGGARVFREAFVPPAPFNGTDVGRSGLLGAVMGAMVGLALIVAREHVADLIRSPRQIAGLVGLPVLTVVPGDGYGRLPDAEEGRIADPYRDVRSALLAGASRRSGKSLGVLQVSSPTDGGDATTTGLNVGLAFARAGRRVVVVSTDFGGGGLHDLLELPDDFGLATVVAEHVSAMTVVHSSLDTPNLMVLQAGPLPGGTEAADLLAMPESDGVFGELSAAADLVIVVSPPVLGSAVAATVAKRANAVVLVVRAGLTRRADLRAALEAFAKVGAPIVGVVFHERRSRRTERGSRDVLAVGWAHPPERTKDAREEQVQVR